MVGVAVPNSGIQALQEQIVLYEVHSKSFEPAEVACLLQLIAVLFRAENSSDSKPTVGARQYGAGRRGVENTGLYTGPKESDCDVVHRYTLPRLWRKQIAVII